MSSRESAERERREPARRGTVAAAERCAWLAAEYVAEMTGREPETVVSVERADEGGWLVDVEVVETHRVPGSTDILAIYEAELDPEGGLVAYRRLKRYSRCQLEDR